MKKIIITALVALFALNAAACGSDPVANAKADSKPSVEDEMVRTKPEPEVDETEELRAEAATVVVEMSTLAGKGANTNDMSEACNDILPKMQSKLDLLSDLIEKMDEADADIDLSALRSTQSDMEGTTGSIEKWCDSAGL